MKVEYVSPFVDASVSVIQALLNVNPERGQLSARPQMFTTQQVNILCGVTGNIEGQVIYGMSIISADKIASLMIGASVVTFDQLAASAIAELGNMISGNSMTLLAASGFTCDITPPTIIRGSNVKVSTVDIPALVIPMRLKDIGDFEITVSLKQRKAATKAA
jgi:chemotaxis protein CheX